MHALIRSAPTTPRSTSPLSAADPDEWEHAAPSSTGGMFTRSHDSHLETSRTDLEATLAKERREHAAMEVALSEAYTATLKELIQKQGDAGPPTPPRGAAGRSAGGSGGSGGGHSGGKPTRSWFR